MRDVMQPMRCQVIACLLDAPSRLGPIDCASGHCPIIASPIERGNILLVALAMPLMTCPFHCPNGRDQRFKTLLYPRSCPTAIALVPGLPFFSHASGHPDTLPDATSSQSRKRQHSVLILVLQAVTLPPRLTPHDKAEKITLSVRTMLS